MPIKKCELKSYLSRYVSSAEKTELVIQQGVLLVSVIDYLANIDKHKQLSLPAEDIRVGKKTLIRFVNDHLQPYIDKVNGYLRKTGHAREYNFDSLTAEDLVGAFYRLKHALYPYTARGFEFTFYGGIGGIAVIMQEGSRKQVCLNVYHLRIHILEAIDSYFDDRQSESVRKAIDRFCETHDPPHPVGLLVLDR